MSATIEMSVGKKKESLYQAKLFVPARRKYFSNNLVGEKKTAEYSLSADVASGMLLDPKSFASV